MVQSSGMILNGWGWSKALWTVDRRWMIPDYGESSMDRQLDQLSHMCRRHQPLHLVGWSMGGILALRMFHDRPEWFERISLIACNPCFVGAPDWPGVGLSMWSDFAEHLKQSPEKQWWRFVALQLLGEAQSVALMRQIRQNRMCQPYGPWLEQLEWLQFDARSLLADIPVPCRLLLGNADRLVPVSLARLWPANWHIDVWDGVGHLLPLSASRLQTWLNVEES